MPEETIAGILFQAGVVGAFIIYALARDRREQAERRERDVQWRDFLAEQSAAFVKASQDRDTAMATLLGSEREQRREGMEAGRSYVSELATAIGALTEALNKHESLAQKRHLRTIDTVLAVGAAGRRVARDGVTRPLRKAGGR